MQVNKSMLAIGITPDQQQGISRLLATLLHLGNVSREHQYLSSLSACF